MSKTTIYLAGPMTGYPDDNKPAFNEAAAKLRDLGFEVINPTELDDAGPKLTVREDFYRRDLPYIAQADLIVVLDGWRSSRGAVMEVLIGNKLLDIPILAFPDLKPLARLLLPVLSNTGVPN